MLLFFLGLFTGAVIMFVVPSAIYDALFRFSLGTRGEHADWSAIILVMLLYLCVLLLSSVVL